MEIGLANEEKGISYFDLVYGLHGTKEKKFSKESEFTFFNWFYENYDCSEPSWTNTNYKHLFWNFLTENERGNTYHESGVNRQLFNLLNMPFFLKGTASKQYLDYKELQISTKSAKSARFWAIISIIVALFAIAISAYSISSSPEPPYDVKIIEDTTRAIELEKVNEGLEKENDSLSKELFKAEIMVSELKEGKK